ncbi:hypothetical protein J8I87_09550 [Paraburkholderia sp. LEh10]|nr:hypothetical protein [Paraburkholderia sp. LEh10]
MSKPGKPNVDEPGCGAATSCNVRRHPGEAGIISHEGGSGECHLRRAQV